MKKKEKIQNIYPLSPMQSSMLFHSMLNPDSAAYFEQSTFKIEGDVNITFLEKSFQSLVDRYDIFRTIFRTEKFKEPIQIVLSERTAPIHYKDVSSHLKDAGDEEIKHHIDELKKNDTANRFDLAKDLLLRLSLVKTGEQTYYLIFSFHHIVMDGWCLAIVFKELLQLYRSQKTGAPPGLEKVTPYVTYIRWLENQDKSAGYRLWEKHLEGYEEPAALPKIHPHPGTYNLEEYPLYIPEPITDELNRTARANRITINTLFQTIWGLVLQKYNNRGDVTFGAVVSGRPPEINGIETIVGLFINTIPVRIRTKPYQDFSRLLTDVQTESALLKNHEYLPLSQIQANTLLKGDLLDHIIVFENFPIQEEVTNAGNRDGDTGFQVLSMVMHEQSNYDFNIVVAPGKSIVVKFSYNSLVYPPEFIKKLAARLMELIRLLVKKPDTLIKNIDILTADEKQQLLRDFNRTEAPYPEGKTIHQIFEEKARQVPDNIAVSSPLDLTGIYKRLETKSDSLDGASDEQMYTCRFSASDYIHRSELQIPRREGNSTTVLLKSNEHDSILVNRNIAALLPYFNGKTNLRSLYTAICHFQEHSPEPIVFTVHSIVQSDLLEVAFKFNDNPGRFIINSFDDFLQLVKILYRHRLIHLSDIRPNRPGFRLDSPEAPPFSFDTNESEETVFDSAFLFNAGEKNEPGGVLILGDTPGIASTGILYLGSYLRRNGIRAFCRLYDNSLDYASMKTNVYRLLGQLQPEVVAVSLKWFLYIARVIDICEIIKEYAAEHSLNIKVVVGGNTASYYRREIITHDCIDYLVCGDGEEPLLKICGGEAEIPNCLYKKDGKIVESPISYVQDDTNSDEIYLSHLPETVISPYASLFGSFFIYTHKGCTMNCLYCGGCREAQHKTFNRRKVLKRDVREVRKDITAAIPYASTFQFDFDIPTHDLTGYCRGIWENLDLSNHFCIIAVLTPPSPELIKLISETFKYVYWDFDVSTLSERHRKQLVSLKLLKPQPSDRDILAFLDRCDAYSNIEVRLNLITGLPHFTVEDVEPSEALLDKIIGSYHCFGELHWARLHAQPGAPIVENPGRYHMHSPASSFEDFLTFSRKNFNRQTGYSTVEEFEYPYIYFDDNDLNSKITEFYMTNNRKIARFKENRKWRFNINQTLTYRELNQKANQLATLLRENNAGPGSIVGLMLERSTYIPLATLAVLKAGGSYMPIDPDTPPGRVTYMLTDSGCNQLISHRHLLDKFEVPEGCRLLAVDEPAIYPEEASGKENLSYVNQPSDVVYTIYTSGTTGKPKGVLLEHRNLVNYVDWFSTACGLTEEDKSILTSSFAFDLGYTSLYTSILNGGELHILSREHYLTADRLVDYIRREKITYLKVTPSLFSIIVNHPTFTQRNCPTLRLTAIGGEAINVEDLERAHALSPGLRIMNHYGPTEATIGCVSTFVDFGNFEDYKKFPVIGKPIHNTRVYILDKELNPLPAGIPGELNIAGTDLARGYLNRPELTSQKFVSMEEKENNIPDSRVYRTGDLGRWRKNGTIEFLGRIDSQVKVRGYRIELGEIESLLLKHPQVEQAALLVRKPAAGGENDDKFLCAYVVPKVKDARLNAASTQSQEVPRLVELAVSHQLPEPPVDYLSTGPQAAPPSLLSLFREQVERRGQNIAVSSGNRSLDFGTLDRLANRTAHAIIQNYDDRYMLSAPERTRYKRQLLLHNWGTSAQEKLKSTTVFVAGAGGGASPTVTQLVLAGFGNIIICDFDVVELSNLNRQFLHDESRIGMNKALSARMTVNKLNPNINIIPRTEKLTRENIAQLIGDADIIFDMFDGLEAKFLLSEFAFSRGIPHIISAMADINGYSAIFNPPHSPCYHCVFDKTKWETIIQGMGNYMDEYEKNPLPVIATSLFMSSSFSVNEAIKIILGFENPAYGKFAYFNQRGSEQLSSTPSFQAMTHAFSAHFMAQCKEQGFDWDIGWRNRLLEEFTITPNPQCPLCGKQSKKTDAFQVPGDAAISSREQLTPASPEPERSPRVVSLLTAPTVDRAVGIIGSLKAGKTYLPLTPDSPQDRQIKLLEDSGARIILCDEANLESAKKLREKVNKNIKIINISTLTDEAASTSESLPEGEPTVPTSAEQAAYLLYPNDSDSPVQGVMENHSDVLTFLNTYSYYLENTPGPSPIFSTYNYGLGTIGPELFHDLFNGVTHRFEPPASDGVSPGSHAAELREYLRRELPDYMIPSFFVTLEEMPLTPNGKVDRKALPEPGIQLTEVAHKAPRNHIEAALVEIWAEILKKDKEHIGIDTNFFELGGHSLSATVLIGRIHKEFSIRVPMGEIFKSPTLKCLAGYIENASREEYSAIPPAGKKSHYPLSSHQKRLYILYCMEPQLTAYNIMEVFELKGQLELEKIQEVFKQLIQRHEALRTSFEMQTGTPVQSVHDADNISWSAQYHDYSGGYPEDSPPASIFRGFIQPFDLSQAPLLRVDVVKIPNGSHVFVVDTHHIVSDGVSHGVLIDDFFAIYNGQTLPPLKIQYKDYASWQQSKEMQEKIKQQEAYWLNTFAEPIPLLNLPNDKPRPPIQTFDGQSASFILGSEETRKLNHVAHGEGVSLFMVLLSLYYVFLYKLSGQEDIVIGTPTAGRHHPDLERVIGMFVNTLALRHSPSGKKSFKGFLKEIKEKTLEAFRNQDYAFEDLVEKVEVQRDMSRNPLFDVMFVLQNIEVASAEEAEKQMEGFSIKPFQVDAQTTLFDLSLVAVEKKDSLLFTFEYCNHLFHAASIQRFISFFNTITSTVISEPETTFARLDILPEEDKKLILSSFNDTDAPYPQDLTVIQIFEKQLWLTPGEPAIIEPLSSEEAPLPRTFSYREFDRLSGVLALRLKEKGIGSGVIAGIMLERSLEMMLGIFAVLKAGGAYLPIAPDYPEERVRFILADSNARLLLTVPSSESAIDPGVETVSIVPGNLSSESLSPGLPSTNPTDPAYVIYTSGTTGKPKGVLIEHHSLTNRLNWMQKTYPIGIGDTLLQKTPFTFDVSVWELFWWSQVGAALCLMPPGGEKDPAMMVDTIEKSRVTVMHFVPSMLTLFLEHLEADGETGRVSSLKQVIASGEALSLSQVQRFNRLLNQTNETRLANLYGPTEATIDVSYFDCSTGEELQGVPIGKPIDNIKLVILDKEGRLQPIGLMGELFIGGAGLARGYLNRPELTAEKFASLPSLSQFSSPLYRTGDLARRLPDGNIEYLGRIDHQVKIRGFRIELEEIEAQLCRHETIKESVVLARGAGEKESALWAYLVTEFPPGTEPEPTTVNVSDLRAFLSKTLPEYMIPSHFVLVENIPLTANGKVDRKTLERSGSSIGTGTQYIEPGSDTEKTIANAWKEILGLEKVGIHDNFFEVGGNSLQAIRLNSTLNQLLEKEIPVLMLFEHVTIDSLARHLERMETATEEEEKLLDRSDAIDRAKKRRTDRRSRKRPREV